MKKIYSVFTSVSNDHIKKKQYTQKNVVWLKKQLDRHMPNFEFVCLTNDKSLEYDMNIEPLICDYPGWWSKIELFRYSDVFYLDLDTVIIRPFNHLLELKGFHISQDVSKKIDPITNRRLFGSAVMTWDVAPMHVYNNFHKGLMKKYTTSERWGDQGYIFDQMRNVNYFQDTFRNCIQSYKLDKLKSNRKPKTDIVVFHGKPTPWEVDHPWVPKS